MPLLNGVLLPLKILFILIHLHPTVCQIGASTLLERAGVFAIIQPDPKRKIPAKVSAAAEVTLSVRFSASNNADANFIGVVTLIVRNVSGKKLYQSATDLQYLYKNIS